MIITIMTLKDDDDDTKYIKLPLLLLSLFRNLHYCYNYQRHYYHHYCRHTIIIAITRTPIQTHVIYWIQPLKLLTYLMTPLVKFRRKEV